MPCLRRVIDPQLMLTVQHFITDMLNAYFNGFTVLVPFHSPAPSSSKHRADPGHNCIQCLHNLRNPTIRTLPGRCNGPLHSLSPTPNRCCMPLLPQSHSTNAAP